MPVPGRSRRLALAFTASAGGRGSRPRINGERLTKGPYGEWLGSLGLRAGVAAPIMVGGTLLGRDGRRDLAGGLPPPGTESRMADFTELAAMAIANAQAEQELRELADTQAALRSRTRRTGARWRPAVTSSPACWRNRPRCAGWPRSSPAGSTRARSSRRSAEEIRRVLDADRAGIARYEQDGESVVVVGGGGEDEDVVKWPAGTRRNGVELLALVRSARPE